MDYMSVQYVQWTTYLYSLCNGLHVCAVCAMAYISVQYVQWEVILCKVDKYKAKRYIILQVKYFAFEGVI